MENRFVRIASLQFTRDFLERYFQRNGSLAAAGGVPPHRMRQPAGSFEFMV